MGSFSCMASGSSCVSGIISSGSSSIGSSIASGINSSSGSRGNSSMGSRKLSMVTDSFLFDIIWLLRLSYSSLFFSCSLLFSLSAPYTPSSTSYISCVMLELGLLATSNPRSPNVSTIDWVATLNSDATLKSFFGLGLVINGVLRRFYQKLIRKMI